MIKKIFIIGLVLMIMASITACTKNDNPFDIKNYITINETGYDEYGTLTASIDYKKLYSEQKNVMNKESIKLQTLLDEQPITIKCSKTENLSNDEEITIQITENPNSIISLQNIFNVDLNRSFKYVISNLHTLTQYNPLEDLNIKSFGLNGIGYLNAKIEHYGKQGSWEWPIEITPNEKISNGDIVKMTINVDDIDYIQKRFGIKISQTEWEYTVEEMTDYIRQESDLKKVSQENINILNTVIENWAISGKNDENQGNHSRKYQFKKAILLQNDESAKICFIYHIDDGFVPDGYYIYISPNYPVLVDNINNALMTEDKKQLSESFALYDKETIRYTEKWGWGQDYERHGFMYNNVPYAGHRTLQEEIDYLIECYPEYTNIYY